MTYTVNQLISDAYYASGVVSREFETVSGPEVAQGLRWLNDLLLKKVIEPDLIPYEKQETFTAVIGQENYSIPGLIKINTLTFLKETVRYYMEFVPRDEYRGRARVENIESLPYQYFFERDLGGATISLYFLPDQAYEFTITGIFRLDTVALGDDLDLVLDRFYTSYIKWSLADVICAEYAMPAPMGVTKQLNEYRALISKQSRPMDVSVYKQTTLGRRNGGINWAYVNLGKGWMA